MVWYRARRVVVYSLHSSLSNYRELKTPGLSRVTESTRCRAKPIRTTEVESTPLAHWHSYVVREQELDIFDVFVLR